MNVIIIDQDASLINRLSKIIIGSFPQVDIIGHAHSTKEGIELIKRNKPDAIFLGFILKDGDAFDILRKVDDLSFKVFFTSGFNQNMNISKEQSGIDFFLKPFDSSKLKEAFDEFTVNKKYKKAVKKRIINFPNVNLLLPIGGAHVAVKTYEIKKCEAQGNYTKFYLKNQHHLVSQPIKYYENLLKDNGFFRINRSIMVNVAHIKKINKMETIELIDNEKISVSRRNRLQLKKLVAELS